MILFDHVDLKATHQLRSKYVPSSYRKSTEQQDEKGRTVPSPFEHFQQVMSDKKLTKAQKKQRLQEWRYRQEMMEARAEHQEATTRRSKTVQAVENSHSSEAVQSVLNSDARATMQQENAGQKLENAMDGFMAVALQAVDEDSEESENEEESSS